MTVYSLFLFFLSIYHNDLDLRIASCDYADDLLTFAELWEDEWMMHQCVHAVKINVNKCRYFISNWKENDPRWLPSVDGKSKIFPQPPSTLSAI
jgi:hypothetical protein